MYITIETAAQSSNPKSKTPLILICEPDFRDLRPFLAVFALARVADLDLVDLVALRLLAFLRRLRGGGIETIKDHIGQLGWEEQPGSGYNFRGTVFFSKIFNIFVAYD